MRVLIVEDDPEVRASLRRSLRFEGYDVDTAEDGEDGLAAVARHRPDAVLLDLQLPRLDGMEVCRRLRAAGENVGVLMLTARDTTRDRVGGLDAGADDYLAKPFALEELLARLRAMLRRRSAPDFAEQVLTVDSLRMDQRSREVRRGERDLILTRTEHELLELFMSHARQVLPRASILQAVWGADFDPNSNSLEVHIGYLRRKMEEGGEARLLQTVRGVGYVLRPEAPSTGRRERP